jgi:PIN domain nuclease of toxin-antitoxin system
MILLDTHAWLWWAGDRGKLSSRARARLDAEHDLAISAMSCWEVGMLIERGRLRLAPDARTGIQEALSIPSLRVVPVTQTVATEAGLLGRGFHGDPADRIIVATALEIGAALVTKDARIRSSKIVSTVW